MKQVGNHLQYLVAEKPTAEALLAGAAIQSAAHALAAVSTTGIARGVYRFKSHAEANRHAEEGLARAMAENMRARGLVE